MRGLILLASALIATPAGASPWPDTPLGRAQALAAIQSLEIALLSHDSATLVLDDWCAGHRLAPAGTKIMSASGSYLPWARR